jgi:hypothetical protein
VTALKSAQRWDLIFWGLAMPPLKFICPATENEVDTGIDLDAKDFAGLHDDTGLSCPHCSEPHRLGGVQAWLGDIQPKHE